MVASHRSGADDTLVASENSTDITGTAFLWFRADLPDEIAARYWHDVHGVMAARIAGIHHYRQFVLGATHDDLGATIDGVEFDVDPGQGVDGIPQVMYRSMADMKDVTADPFVTDAIREDEGKFLRRNALQASMPGNAHTYLDETGETRVQGIPAIPRFVVCFGQEPDTPPERFRDVLRTIASAWSDLPAVLRLRLHVLEPHNPDAWDPVDVETTYPADWEYRAWIELAVEDGDLERCFSGDSPVTDAVDLLDVVHAYDVAELYTMVEGGNPTPVGLRGLSAVQLIERAGADNQLREDLLSFTYGSAVEGRPPE